MKNDRNKPFRKTAGHGKGGARAPKSGKPAAGASADAERIAKRLARAGVASRREAEAMISEGRIAVNGKVIDSPALNVSGSDRIEVDGAPIPEIERTRLFLYHKPAGLVTTNRDPEGRKTVFESLPDDLPRLVTVGRLDINTEGLLLLTNDGGLSRVLELPSTGWLRRYRVRVHGKVDEKALADLKEGIAVDGVFYGAVDASLERLQGSNAWLSIGLREGKNREVKNILAELGLDVTRLIRVSYGPFQLADLPEGAVRELRGRALRDQLGPRLIEQSGANFDAPVINQRNPEGEAGKPERGQSAPRPGRRERMEDARDKALSRLSTKPGGDKPEKDGDKPRSANDRRSRASNVWMAKGARPLGPKAASAAAAKTPLADPNRRVDKKADEAGQSDRFKSDKPAPGKYRSGKPGPRKDASGRAAPERSGYDRGGEGKPAHGKSSSAREGYERGGPRKPAYGKTSSDRTGGYSKGDSGKPAFGKPARKGGGSDRGSYRKSGEGRPSGEKRGGYDKAGSGRPQRDGAGNNKSATGKPRFKAGAKDAGPRKDSGPRKPRPGGRPDAGRRR